MGRPRKNHPVTECLCGCGGAVTGWNYNLRAPKRFVKGHYRRGRLIDDPTYNTVHRWLAQNHPKKGVCEKCDAPGPTEYAYIVGRGGYRRDRNSYRELCIPCHRRYDLRLKEKYEESVGAITRQDTQSSAIGVGT